MALVCLCIAVVLTFFIISILKPCTQDELLSVKKIPIAFCSRLFGNGDKIKSATGAGILLNFKTRKLSSSKRCNCSPNVAYGRKDKSIVDFIACAFLGFAVLIGPVQASEEESKAVDRFMTLGTPKGQVGGEDFQSFERQEIKTQIKTFIPPLLRPAFTQHAFVLPPNALSVSVSHRFTEIQGDQDFFKDGRVNKATFGDFSIDRHLTDFDLFYGFDLNHKYLHGFTLRLNVPYFDTQTNGAVHPNGQPFIGIENAGSSQGIGDVGIFLKKKLMDQGNSPFGLAIVGAVILPTGNHDDTFGSNGRVTATRPQPPNLVAAQEWKLNNFDILTRPFPPA